MSINPKTDQLGKPHFLCIGAPRTSTTWLHYCLSQHSQIYIPPRKELNYFGKYRSTTKQFLQSCYRTILDYVIKTIKGTRIESPHQAFLALRWQLSPQSLLFVLIHMLAFPFKVYRLMIRRETEELRWYLKYYLGRLYLNPEKWYASLFEPTGQQICGEFTPVYAGFPNSSIEYMMSFNKHMRIIYLIRNPIERDWSHISLWTVNPGGSLPMSVVQKYTDRLQSFSNYLGNLKRYLKYIPPENLFLGFYEDILFHQKRYMAALQEFLGVSEEDIIQKPRYTGGYKGIKLEYAVYLAQRNLLNIREMASIFGGYTTFWLNVASELCETDTTSHSDETFISTPFATNDLWRPRWEYLGAKDFQSGPLSSLPSVNKLIS